MDHILISDLRLSLRVGCTARERSRRQRAALDVSIGFPLRRAGRSDDLRHTIDYARAAARLRRSLAERSFHTLEAAAEQAAILLLRHFPARQVRVRVRKFSLPGMGWAGVEIKRRR